MAFVPTMPSGMYSTVGGNSTASMTAATYVQPQVQGYSAPIMGATAYSYPGLQAYGQGMPAYTQQYGQQFGTQYSMGMMGMGMVQPQGMMATTAPSLPFQMDALTYASPSPFSGGSFFGGTPWGATTSGYQSYVPNYFGSMGAMASSYVSTPTSYWNAPYGATPYAAPPVMMAPAYVPPMPQPAPVYPNTYMIPQITAPPPPPVELYDPPTVVEAPPPQPMPMPEPVVMAPPAPPPPRYQYRVVVKSSDPRLQEEAQRLLEELGADTDPERLLAEAQRRLDSADGQGDGKFHGAKIMASDSGPQPPAMVDMGTVDRGGQASPYAVPEFQGLPVVP